MVTWRKITHLGCKLGAQAVLIGSGVMAGYRYSEHLAAAQESLEESLRPSEYTQKVQILEELITYGNR